MHRGDAVRIGWKDVKDDIIHLKTEKSQFKTDVFLLILPELAETLKIGPIGGENSFVVKAEINSLKKVLAIYFVRHVIQRVLKNQHTACEN
ncbi:hypothetical protein HNQ69_001211 [Bartonella callosciuri]|uniref:Uncharacterized protein n=1 Tax=Bartonella callosciuri TaxID=686223 RepID=A0A840P1B0_9HYPH|nr:hypothetical protein [Bartonella callosciuri]